MSEITREKYEEAKRIVIEYEENQMSYRKCYILAPIDKADKAIVTTSKIFAERKYAEGKCRLIPTILYEKI
jgi:hypothetical protein